MRIVSLLPSATEIVCALGLTDALVGVTHECDYPPEVRDKPVLTASRIHGHGLTSAEIEHAVSTRLGGHRSLYTLNEARLRELQPDLVLTQELCEVCAVSYEEVKHAARLLRTETQVVSLEPTTLDDVLGTIELVGGLTGRQAHASELVTALRARVAVVRDRVTATTSRPRVWVSEWLEPPYSAGHWVAAQVEAAGGREVFHRAGVPSTRVTSEEILAAAPDVVVLAPCGFHLDAVEREARRVTPFPGWGHLPAVQRGQVWAVDASSYYSRPGPRLVGGVELMAQILHPDLFGEPSPEAARRLALPRSAVPTAARDGTLAGGEPQPRESSIFDPGSHDAG
jgi:iron complex transport system substrate-binding protein